MPASMAARVVSTNPVGQLAAWFCAWADVRETVTIVARLLATAFLLLPPASAPFAADEASYPSKQIRIVVGFAAGGPADALAPRIGDRLTQKWGQAVVVENRTGANGNLAMAAVAKSPPDGYTLALVPVGNAAVNPSLFADLPYEMGQFAPITQIANVENVFVTSAKSQIKSLQPKARKDFAPEELSEVFARFGADQPSEFSASFALVRLTVSVTLSSGRKVCLRKLRHEP